MAEGRRRYIWRAFGYQEAAALIWDAGRVDWTVFNGTRQMANRVFGAGLLLLFPPSVMQAKQSKACIDIESICRESILLSLISCGKDNEVEKEAPPPLV